MAISSNSANMNLQKLADAIKEIAQCPNKYKEKIKLENIKKDF